MPTGRARPRPRHNCGWTRSARRTPSSAGPRPSSARALPRSLPTKRGRRCRPPSERPTRQPAGQSVLVDDAAEQGGAQLAGFIEGLLAARSTDPHLTALGHSYGSTTTGHALQQVDGVDDAILFGSPGASTGDVGDLRVPPGHLGVLEARGDWIAGLGSFGRDTNQLDDVTNLSAAEEIAPDGTRLLESEGHSEYLVPGTTSQHNIAATVAGLPDKRITGPNSGTGDVLREAWDAF